MIDALASERQYLEHLAPVWLALAPGERGTFWVAGALADEAGREGVGEAAVGWPPVADRPCLVASYSDHVTARGRGRPVAYLEHGAGQTYVTEGEPHPSYSGSPGHDGTALFLCPSEAVAGRWRARYPGTPAVAVGCPKLDALHRAAPWRPRRAGSPVAAISFHSPVRLCPETFGAWEHFSAGLGAAVAELGRRGVSVLGHAHPRLWGRLGPRWAALGAEPVADFAEVLCRADAYAVDNSSTLYEAAALGIPVVALNAPWFRRDVHHGLRFWDLVPGPQCDSAAELPDALTLALADPPEVREHRERVVRAVYAHVDGRAAERAVGAIRAHVTG